MVEETLVASLRQAPSAVRFDWGLAAARQLADDEGALVVVDALSFTTAVSVATGRGIAVLPWDLHLEGADRLAAAEGAGCAVARRMRSPAHPWTLSPRALLDAPFVERLVLPSPNGSAIAAAFAPSHRRSADPRVDDPRVDDPRVDDPGVASRGPADAGRSGPAVLAGCLRNASATARWLAAGGYGTVGRSVTVIAAGERWPDGSLRPALEDLLGAGAIIERLRVLGDLGTGALSPESQVAASAFERWGAGGDLVAVLERGASGQELAAMGFADEVAIAGAVDADAHVSLLEGAAFVAA